MLVVVLIEDRELSRADKSASLRLRSIFASTGFHQCNNIMALK